MIVIGAKGFAKEVLEVLIQNNASDNLAFYDDINDDIGDLLFNKYPILKNLEQVRDFFEITDNNFTIGIGNPYLRKELCEKFLKIDGNLISVISNKTNIGHYDVEIGEGCNILQNALISNSVKIGKGCIVYYNVLITHDCEIGDFVEISPNAIILGGAKIGSYTQLGANSIILPNVEVGQNCIIGAGSVVNRNIPDNSVAYGVPAVIKRQL